MKYWTVIDSEGKPCGVTYDYLYTIKEFTDLNCYEKLKGAYQYLEYINKGVEAGLEVDNDVKLPLQIGVANISIDINPQDKPNDVIKFL